MLNLKGDSWNISKSLIKVILLIAFVLLPSCRDVPFVYPDGYDAGKWPGGYVEEVHEVLVKNNITDCTINDEGKSVFYVLKRNQKIEGEYLVDCRNRSWWESFFGDGPAIYKVQVKTQEIVRVY
ncbi:MAG: hypothetical protein PHX61_01340 [Alphaproteobacteria bacterium]|nr:hypothetical protein [Alphaproteobacteria bacterium]